MTHSLSPVVLLQRNDLYVREDRFRTEHYRERDSEFAKRIREQSGSIKPRLYAEAVDSITCKLSRGENRYQDFSATLVAYYNAAGRPVAAAIKAGQVFIQMVSLSLGAESLRVWVEDSKKSGGVFRDRKTAWAWRSEEDNAAALYAWEELTFKDDIYNIHQLRELPSEAAKLARRGNKSQLLTVAESLDLIEQVAGDYGIKNVRVNLVPFESTGTIAEGKIIAQASITSSLLPFELPREVSLVFSDTLLLKHIVLHEMAHAIELWRIGSSAHGLGFRSYYSELLAKYMGLAHPPQTMLVKSNTAYPPVTLYQE